MKERERRGPDSGRQARSVVARGTAVLATLPRGEGGANCPLPCVKEGAEGKGVLSGRRGRGMLLVMSMRKRGRRESGENKGYRDMITSF